MGFPSLLLDTAALAGSVHSLLGTWLASGSLKNSWTLFCPPSNLWFPLAQGGTKSLSPKAGGTSGPTPFQVPLVLGLFWTPALGPPMGLRQLLMGLGAWEQAIHTLEPV